MSTMVGRRLMSHESFNTATDVVAGAVGVAALLQWLPPVAAALTIVWTVLRIYEWIEGRLKGRNYGGKDSSG